MTETLPREGHEGLARAERYSHDASMLKKTLSRCLNAEKDPLTRENSALSRGR